MCGSSTNATCKKLDGLCIHQVHLLNSKDIRECQNRDVAKRVLVPSMHLLACWLALGSFFSGVLFISDPSEGEAKKDVAKRGATSQRIQIKWSPPRIIGSDMGTHAATSTRRATPKDPRSMKERAWERVE